MENLIQTLIESNELYLPVRVNEIPNYSEGADVETSMWIKEMNRKITEEPFASEFRADTAPGDQGQEGSGPIWIAGKGLYGSGKGIIRGDCSTKSYCKPSGPMTGGRLQYGSGGGGGKSEPGIPVQPTTVQNVYFYDAHDPAFRLKNSV